MTPDYELIDWNNRDNQICFYCGDAKATTWDHIYPSSKGGSHRPGNLVAACRSCNASKNNRTPREWVDSLIRRRDWDSTECNQSCRCCSASKSQPAPLKPRHLLVLRRMDALIALDDLVSEREGAA